MYFRARASTAWGIRRRTGRSCVSASDCRPCPVCWFPYTQAGLRGDVAGSLEVLQRAPSAEPDHRAAISRPKGEGRPQIPALTGLRFFAAFFILFAHAFDWIAQFQDRSVRTYFVFV